MKRWRPGFYALAVLLSATSAALAQGTSIRGTVRDSASRAGVVGAQVQIVGTTRGTITDSVGEYIIRDVAAGTHSVRAQRLGYASATRTVRVNPGETAVADFAVNAVVPQLTEVVVTGYGTAQRREVSSAVATVQAQEISNAPVAGVDAALQGKAAGVQVIQNAGNPGNGITVRVRGASSISASNQPLYVIDGVPMIRDNYSQLDMAGQDVTAVTGISPDEIASLDILKDASAAAIYGSRASNGVVMITTKRGQANRPKLSINAYNGWQEVEKKVRMMTASEYVDFMFDALLQDGYDEADIPDQVGFDRTAATSTTNWQDEIFRPAPVRDVAVSASGGTDRTQYFLSGAHFQQDGIVIGSAYNRQNIRGNFDFKATNRLSVRSSLAFSREANQRNENDNTLDGVVTNAIATAAIFPVRHPDGSFTSTDDGLTYTNPVAIGTLDDAETRTYRGLGNVEANFLFNEKFNLTGRVGGDVLNLRDLRWNSPQIIGRYAASANGVAQQGNNTASRYITELFGTYDQAFGTNHLNATLGTSSEWNSSELEFMQGEGFANEAFRYPGNAGKITSYDGSRTGHNLVSVFSRANLAIKDRYFLNGSLREDGSSRFGVNNRYGIFPAASLGWMISDESFMSSLPRFGDLKLRASYGLTGNQGIGDDFAPLTRFGKANYSDAPGIAPSDIGNPDLKWETTAETDLGFDLFVLGGRVALLGDWYNKDTRDLLVLRPIARSSGFTSFWDNIGSMENSGYELGLNTTNLQPSTANGLRWTTDFNISWNRNRVTALYHDEPFNSGIRSVNRVEVGAPIGAFQTLVFQGVDPQTGDAIFKDVNGDGQITADDRAIVGSPHPDYWGGLGNTVSWKGLELRGFFQFSQGAEVYNAMRIFSGDGGFNLDNKFADQLKSWKQPGDITNVPRSSWDGTSGADLVSSRFMEDGSYWRLQELTLSYKIPQRYARVSQLDNASVFLSGRNIKTWTKYSGYNPDVNSIGSSANISLGTDFYAYPLARTWQIGLRGDF
ncbi:MAG TPA: TonB-dependent receptor [Gemmatimonadaceae bacterium]|nr:TonB-dependent receptor [Gemmatimonadaceae bacterium]